MYMCVCVCVGVGGWVGGYECVGVGVARAMSYISMKAPTSPKMSEASCAVVCVYV